MGTRMRDQTDWSLSIGTWFGVPIRIHMFVLLFAVLSISLAWQFDGPGGEVVSPAALPFAIGMAWLVALVLHEVGHILAAAHLGGEILSATILPWGSDFEASNGPGWSRVFIYLAGPAANLFVAAFLTAVLIAFRKEAPISPGFFNLLAPERLLLNNNTLDDFVRLVIFANWLMAMINLVPAFLFDGGFICFSLMQSAWPLRPNQKLFLHCSLITQVFAVMLFAAAIVSQAGADTEVLPAWLGLSLFSVVLMFASRTFPPQLKGNPDSQSVRDSLFRIGGSNEEVYLSENSERFMEIMSFDDDGEVELEDEESLSRWLKERQLERVEQARENEANEEKLADDILKKVHRSGIDSLTTEEKAVLQRVSVRFRNRQREQA